MKVRIKQLPKKAYGGQQAGGALNVTPAKWGGAENNAREGKEVKQSLTKVPRSMANLEAEGGETAFGPISGDTIPDHFKIKGPRHHSGGVPLNLPEDTFIFSDTKAMRITDPGILKMFDKKPKKGGYTPAELAKPYDINKYKAILMDPESDKKSRDTATLMIKNYIIKLGALALAQESKKGFPQGIPQMARPYMEANNITDEDLIPQEEGSQEQEPMMRTGGITKFAGGGSPDDTDPKTLIADINRITIDGSLGANRASILKDGKPITSSDGYVEVTGVRADGESITITTNVIGMKNATLGTFVKKGSGYKFVPNKFIWGKFEKSATAEDKRLFNSFIEGVETNSSFRQDVQGAIKGTNKYEPKTKTKEYFAPSGTTPKPTPNAVPGENEPEPVLNATPDQGTVVNDGVITTSNTLPSPEEDDKANYIEIDKKNYYKHKEDIAKRKADVEYQKYKGGDNAIKINPNPNDPIYQDMLKRHRKDLGLDQNSNQSSNGTMRVETPYGGQGTQFDPIFVRSKDDIPGGAALSKSGWVSHDNGLIYAIDSRAGFVDPNTIQGNNTASSDYIPSLSNDQNAFLQSLPADQRQLYMNMMNNQGATWMNDPNNFSRENFRSPYESRLGWSPRNPLSLKSSYTPEFNWLSPMGAARMTRPGVQGSMPISGFPTDSKLTSIEADIEVNPWLKALFNKDIARRSLHTRFGFNEDLSKFTDDSEDLSNAEFAKKQFPEDDKFAKKNRKELEKILNKGNLTQEEYLASQQPLEDSEVVENKKTTEGESDSPAMNYVPSEGDVNNPVGAGDVDDLDLDSNAGLQEIADAQDPAQQDPALSDDAIYQMKEGERVWVDENGKRTSFDPNRGIKQDQWYLENNDQKIAMDNIYQNILDAPYDEQAELMAIDGITRKDLQEYKTMGPAYAADSRNERIDFQNDVDAGMYKEAVEALGAGANSSEIMEWQSDYNSEQRSKIKFEDNKKRFGGTHSGLYKFVLGGFDPSLALREGTMQGANKQEREQNYFDDLIYNEDNLDNLTIDQLSDRNSQLLADDPVSQMEYDPGMPPPPPNVGQDGSNEFFVETDQKINTAGKFSPETFRQKAGFVSNLATKAGDAVQDWKNRGSLVNKLFKKSQNANVSQAVNMGDEYANTQGQIAPGSQSRSELMRTMGTTLGRYGGSMAEYGSEMGGSYYPTMSTGATRRVRISALPRKDGGGPAGHPHPHPSSSAGEQTYIGGSPEWLSYYNSEEAEDYRTNRYNAYAERRGVTGKPVINAEDYHKLYGESQRQVYDMNKFYEGDAGYMNRSDWDSSYEFDPKYANSKAAEGDRTMHGKNWRYHKAIEDMNAKIKADNAGMDPAELNKLLYTDFNEDDISNSQSGYIGGLVSSAAGDLTGQARQDFIHTGVNDQTVDINGVKQNVTPEDGMGGNTWNNQLDALTIAKRIEEAEEEEEIIPPEETPEETTPETTPVKKPDPEDSSVENCYCYPLGPDGKPDETKTPISSTPAPTDGSPCPPCNATISGRKKQKDDAYEVPRRTDQHYRNMASINRYKLPNMRVNPPQVGNRETVSTLTNFYTGDITSQQNALQRSNNAYAGNSQQAFAKNLAVMSKGLPMTGKRAQDKSGENALKVDKAGQINAQLGQRSDQLNASLLASAGQLNAKYKGENIKAGNAKLAALNLEDQRGQNEMEQAMMWNYRNPNHQLGYRGHTPWFRRSYKNANLDPNLVASNTTPKTKTEAKKKTGSNTSKYGGPVNSSTFIPRYTTMPFGN